MSALGETAAAYLSLRRSLGYKLQRQDRVLADFIAYLDEHHEATITTEAALAWACQPPEAGPVRWEKRLTTARSFAAYMLSIDPATQVPPARMWPRRRRPQPFIYSPAQIADIVEVAGSFATPYTAATCQCIIGLLAATGMRHGEALRLDDDDFDTELNLVVVRGTKFGKSREVPLHPSTVSALSAYVALRDERFGPAAGANLFACASGRRARQNTVRTHFHAVLERLALAHADGRRPRLHDLRHSFAVNTLRSWHEAGLDVQARLPLLSTYLGHINPAATYWYLTATPDLLRAAADRLEARGQS